MRKDRIAYWQSPDGLKQLEAWARDGLSNAQLAHNIGIGERTLYRWRSKYPEFKAAIARGKEVVDIEVENALHQRAIGYTKELTKKTIIQNRDGTTSQKIETSTVHIAGDTAAMIFWLKNRKPAVWRNEHDHTERDALEKLDKILEEIDRNA